MAKMNYNSSRNRRSISSRRSDYQQAMRLKIPNPNMSSKYESILTKSIVLATKALYDEKSEAASDQLNILYSLRKWGREHGTLTTKQWKLMNNIAYHLGVKFGGSGSMITQARLFKTCYAPRALDRKGRWVAKINTEVAVK